MQAVSSPRSDAPLRTIGSWTVERQLGVGTVGTVYLASRERPPEKTRGEAARGEIAGGETPGGGSADGDETTPANEPARTGQRAAVKILRPDVSTDETIKARFQREIEILEKLSHPNIVEILDSGRHAGQLFYAMEFVDGPSLKEVLAEKGRLEWQDAVEVGWQICSALQHAHNMGIVHRDLKPANLFLTQRGEVKLGDFGIALDTGEAELTATGLTVGTYAFMSPEQIRGERPGGDGSGRYRQGVTGAADIYALGCLLYRMVVGENPFGGANFAQIFEQHLNTPAPAARDHVSDVPLELDRLIREMMAKEQSDRPYNARSVQGRLAEALMQWDEAQGEALAARPATWAIDPARPILSNLIVRRRDEQIVNVGWRQIVILGLTLVAFIAIAVLTR